jgi:hypothetical protein
MTSVGVQPIAPVIASLDFEPTYQGSRWNSWYATPCRRFELLVAVVASIFLFARLTSFAGCFYTISDQSRPRYVDDSGRHSSAHFCLFSLPSGAQIQIHAGARLHTNHAVFEQVKRSAGVCAHTCLPVRLTMLLRARADKHGYTRVFI